MPKLSLGQKSARVLQFLYALGNPRIARAMKSVGFKKSDVDDGWTLLRDLRIVHVDAGPPVDPNALRRLDEWENRWFPVANASLRRHHPTVRDAVFLNLNQAEGLDVIHSVSVFLERVDRLAASSVPADQAAVALLAERGLNAETLGEARELLQRLMSAPMDDAPPTPDDKEALAAREDALWAWYLEWSVLARTVVTDRRLLRSLGFLRSKSKGGVDEEDADGDDDGGDEDDTAPTPAPAPAPVG